MYVGHNVVGFLLFSPVTSSKPKTPAVKMVSSDSKMSVESNFKLIENCKIQVWLDMCNF